MNLHRLAISILLAAGAAALVSCQRTYQITERAKKQLEVSLPEQLPLFVGSCSDISIGPTKTVYDNDSVSLIQFTVKYKDSSGAAAQQDMRYIYLYDSFQSFINRRVTFMEGFKFIPCMPDELIKEMRKKVGENKENVHSSMIGMVKEITDPYDE